PTKCGRYLLRFRLACGLASGKTRLGASGLGGVRSLAFLSILCDRSVVLPHGWILEILAYQRSFSATCQRPPSGHSMASFLLELVHPSIDIQPCSDSVADALGSFRRGLYRRTSRDGALQQRLRRNGVTLLRFLSFLRGTCS